MGSNEMYCSGACREEWNDARRAKEDAKTPYEKIKDENFGCLVMSIVATIFFSLPVVAIIIDRSEPIDSRLYFYGGMFVLFASITFIWIRKMIRDAEEERPKQAKIREEKARTARTASMEVADGLERIKRIKAEDAKFWAAKEAKIEAEAAKLRADVATVRAAEEAAKKRSKNK